MSTAVPFWNYFWHIFGLVCILLISLPTGYWIKINKRFALHRELPQELVADMTYGDTAVPDEARHTLIKAYNEGNFLYRKPRVTHANVEPLMWTVPSWRESYKVYPNTPYVEVAKTRGRKTTIFTLQSPDLHDWLVQQASGEGMGTEE